MLGENVNPRYAYTARCFPVGRILREGWCLVDAKLAPLTWSKRKKLFRPRACASKGLLTRPKNSTRPCQSRSYGGGLARSINRFVYNRLTRVKEKEGRKRPRRWVLVHGSLWQNVGRSFATNTRGVLRSFASRQGFAARARTHIGVCLRSFMKGTLARARGSFIFEWFTFV